MSPPHNKDEFSDITRQNFLTDAKIDSVIYPKKIIDYILEKCYNQI